jgi:hypothetical protein
MQVQGRRYNPKRKLAKQPDLLVCQALAVQVQYVGSPLHKKNPGDFCLTPPSKPHPDKTLCDSVNLFTKKAAQDFLQQGLQNGMISMQTRNGWPQNIWWITDKQQPLEAQLDNQEKGTYHGYPLTQADPFYQLVLASCQLVSQET